MSKQKGKFGLGKHTFDVHLHVKAKRVQKEPFLDVTVRLTERNVREDLLPQIQKFLRELDKQAGAKSGK
jgi:hypothetical protein